ncbi:dnaJ-like protein 60 [Anopheles ziemanni]|uniref:dnaJ-like protein 60 n=1 Tax=Anopheles coustani TaxID=139045 RepID=UPI00265B7066|nr:dnaJ-like protein 60 [Anopheles coustani]XP_058166810.1 dnaJ-like protein 60 [Anopheles ziemanni]
MLKISQQSRVYRAIQAQVRFAHRTHYNVLKLQPDCSTRDVRAAFIQLSKELHPDANVSNKPKQNDKSFIELLEAYKVLIKPESRAAYDYELSVSKHPDFNGQQIFHRPWAENKERYSNADQPYYGIKGVKKVSNWTIVLFCGIFMLIGIVLQAVAISKSFTFKRDQLDEFSRKNAITHAGVREAAEKYGNEAQIERMKAKLSKESI